MTPMQEKMNAALDAMEERDLYSLLMFVLFRLKDLPEYSTLSELSYVLDHKNLSRFLKYYGGMTITIPTKEEFDLVIDALLIYKWTNVDGNDIKKAKSALNMTKERLNAVLPVYSKIVQSIESYNFNTKRGLYHE